jgi:hypothetical protein
MFFRTRNAVAALALSIVAGACGSDSSVAPPPPQSTTLADALAQLSVPALGAATSMSGIPSGALPSLDAAKCSYTPASQSFVCAPVVASGLTIKPSYALLDASGAKQPAFNAATTSAVRANTTISGTLMEGGTAIGVDGQQELTLSGLLTGTHTLDGFSQTTLAGPGSVLTIPLVTVVTTTIDRLVLPANATGPAAWPTSGSITVQSGWQGADTVLFRAKITFTGSSKATVTITTLGSTQTCTVDLASHAPSCQ